MIFNLKPLLESLHTTTQTILRVTKRTFRTKISLYIFFYKKTKVSTGGHVNLFHYLT